MFWFCGLALIFSAFFFFFFVVILQVVKFDLRLVTLVQRKTMNAVQHNTILFGFSLWILAVFAAVFGSICKFVSVSLIAYENMSF